MNFFTIIEGAFALLNSKGRYSQNQLYARGDAVYAKMGGSFVRLGIGGATTVPTIKWVEFDEGETAQITERRGGQPKYEGERSAPVAAE